MVFVPDDRAGHGLYGFRRSGHVARFFRLVEKKRGERRTGSNWLGQVGEAAFCGCLFLLGTLLLSVLVASHIVEPNPGRFAFGYGGWLLILVTTSSIVLGGGGLIWSVLRIGTSVERRSSLARQAADTDFVHAAVPRPRNYPTVPSFDGLTNSPGIELAYRLPTTHSPGWRLLATTIFAMLWCFVVFLLTASVIRGHVNGSHEWLLSVLLPGFWAVCFWAVREFLQLLLQSTGMGQTTLEISDLPLAPGGEYRAWLVQQGNLKMRSLEVSLICEEEATFTQGTDIRTETREVYRQLCFERRDFAIETDQPLSEVCRIAVPISAMHSFQSGHNVVRWKIVVHGQADKWPALVRGFPVVVYPGVMTKEVEVVSRVARQVLTPATPLAAVAGAGA
jgi:hypothetical protein